MRAETPLYLTVAEVARRVGLAKTDTVLKWIATGELTAINVAGTPGGRPTWRIDQLEFERFLERRRTGQSKAVNRRRPPKGPPVTSYF